MNTTDNLKLPLLKPDMPFKEETINSAFKILDSKINDNIKVVGEGGYLLEPIWSDHIITNQSYLRSDTFSWQDGNVYSNAYSHLVNDIQDKTASSETIDGVVINFIMADDEHKIILANDITSVANIDNLYTDRGVAWYFILDTENQRFKLPRSKWNFIRKYPTNVEDYSMYAVVKDPLTPLTLYFYVGEFTQTAIEQTAGITAETLNGKVDIDLDNISKTGKTNIMNCLIPDYSTRVAVPNGYVCEYYCYVWFYGAHNGANQLCYINGISIGNLNANVWGSSPYAKSNAYAFCKPGDIIGFDNGVCYIYKLNGIN